jgi:hypothetical protein
MVLFITEQDVSAPTSHCSFNYSAEASELGWRAGFFPEVLKTSLGNKMDLVLESLTAEQAVYSQVAGCISLVVYNS